MKIGCHVSIAGGIENAPESAKNLDCEAFQIFTRSPHGGKTTEISIDVAKSFLLECKKHKFTAGKDYMTHTPYYINLASENNRIYYGSISALRKELEVATLIEAPHVITHVGSSKDLSGKNIQKQVNEKVMKALKKVHDGYQGSAQLVLEIAAGSGSIIGDTFEEIGYFIKSARKEEIELGFCFDTCHSFAAGYDLRSKEKVDKVFIDIDSKIGKDALRVIHLNDSIGKLGSNLDRHQHIGQGEIGQEGLREVIQRTKQLEINVILETKHDQIKRDLELTKSFREND